MHAEPPLRFSCPHCAAEAVVAAIQGDRCSSCGFEYKRFGPGERRTAEDYFAVLTGQKHLVELPGGRGWIVAHE
jgi:rubredoxin